MVPHESEGSLNYLALGFQGSGRMEKEVENGKKKEIPMKSSTIIPWNPNSWCVFMMNPATFYPPNPKPKTQP